MSTLQPQLLQPNPYPTAKRLSTTREAITGPSKAPLKLDIELAHPKKLCGSCRHRRAIHSLDIGGTHCTAFNCNCPGFHYRNR